MTPGLQKGHWWKAEEQMSHSHSDLRKGSADSLTGQPIEGSSGRKKLITGSAALTSFKRHFLSESGKPNWRREERVRRWGRCQSDWTQSIIPRYITIWPHEHSSHTLFSCATVVCIMQQSPDSFKEFTQNFDLLLKLFCGLTSMWENHLRKVKRNNWKACSPQNLRCISFLQPVFITSTNVVVISFI